MLLVVETITWKPHVETAMEIAAEALAGGERVVYAHLARGLPACEDESVVHRVFDLPAARARRGGAIVARLGGEYRRPTCKHAERRSALAAADELLRGCGMPEDLKKVSYPGFDDIGWGALSSVASVTRNSALSMPEHRQLFRRYLASSLLVFHRTRALIRELRPDRVLLFNGRFATCRAVLRAAEAEGVRWQIHERGRDKDHYWLTESLPHDLDRVQEQMRSIDNPQDGHRFFRSRRERVERAWHSFTKGQEFGLVPRAMSEPGLRWVTFFTSSEDEMLAIGDRFESKRYPTQLDAIRSLGQAVAQFDDMRLCVRVHPHIAIKHGADRAKWRNLELPGALVIGPEEKFDSYALLDMSWVVASYGSTMGIEATYWGRPSLLFSRSFYDRLDVVELAGGAASISEFLKRPSVRSQDATLVYGAFWERLGVPYRHYQAEGLHGGAFDGVSLDDDPWIRIGQRLAGLLSTLRRKSGR